MGRQIETVTGAKEWYVPDVDANRKDPDPFRVLISQLSAADMKKLEVEHLGSVTGAKVNWMERADETVRDIFAKRVHEVYGYSVLDTESGAKREPANGTALYEAIRKAPASEEAVVNDIVSALKDRAKLKEGLWERPRSQSDLSTRVTGSAGAGAVSVAIAPTPLPSLISATPIDGSSGTATPS